MSLILSIATSVPEHRHEQMEILNFMQSIFSRDEGEARKLRYLYKHSGIDTRHSVIPDYGVDPAHRVFYPPTADLEPFPDLEKRMQVYKEKAAGISVRTIRACIAGKLSPAEITHLITVSCTGMSAPGLDLEIMEIMDLPRHIVRTSVNFMGCYAAIHAMKMADAFIKADARANVVIVCTEFCTLHFQKEVNTDNIMSTLLFADGCAALLMQSHEKGNKGIRIRNFYSDVAFKGKQDMSWTLSSTGFLMTLTGYVSDLIRDDVESLLENALRHNQVDKNSIRYWCIHPGGKKILEAVAHGLSLEPHDLRHSYAVLSEYGNMSSPTILFVLKKILDEIVQHPEEEKPGIFGTAFGPGLTMESFIAEYV